MSWAAERGGYGVCRHWSRSVRWGGGVVTDHTAVGAVHPLRGLLVAGERMGWEYQDREQARRPFPEAEPVSPPPAAPAVDARAARAGMWRRLLISAGLGPGSPGFWDVAGLWRRGHPAPTTSGRR